MSELTAAISKSHYTAAGPEDIHYQMLKHLPAAALISLLHILNDIWSSGNFPPGWRTSTVIPVLKPDKEDTVSVRRKQQHRQWMSKAVSANDRVFQIVWQWISQQWASHRESPLAICCDTRDWLAEIIRVLGYLATYVAEHHDTELVLDLLGYIKSVKLSVREPQQALDEVVCTANHARCSVQHSLQPH